MNDAHQNTQSAWGDVLNSQVKFLHAQIAAAISMVEKQGGSSELLEQICSPYYKLLQGIYEDDFPIARAMECSDLLLQLEGTALKSHTPRISLIGTVFSSVRRQVGDVAHALCGVMNGGVLPKDVDLGLSAFAPGSLYLGFSLPDPTVEDENGERNVLGTEDPLYKATREAIRTLGIISRRINEGVSPEEIEKDWPDPRIRDTTLSAIQHLAPTGRAGIDSVRLGGRGVPGADFTQLTPDFRKRVRGWIEHPVKSDEVEEFVGVVREIDLDLRRIEIRRLVETVVEEIRCVYPRELAAVAGKSLDAKVKAFGKVDRSADGKPKMLEIQRLEIVGAPSAPQTTFPDSF